MMVFTQTDLPEPVAPAMSRCGIFARSAMTGFPSRSLPSAMGSAACARLELARLDELAEARPSRGVGFGHFDADGAAPRDRRDDRGCSARASRARGRSTRFAIWRTFTPGAGSTSNCVTIGPVVRPTSSPSTLNVRSASMSFAPSGVELAPADARRCAAAPRSARLRAAALAASTSDSAGARDRGSRRRSGPPAPRRPRPGASSARAARRRQARPPVPRP